MLVLALPLVGIGAENCPTKNCASELLVRRTLYAMRIDGTPPKIDGRLDESIWERAPVAIGFTKTSPEAGAASQLKTEARVLYDKDAVYVSMQMNQDPVMIVAPFVRRDDETNCDWAFVEIDSRHDSRSGFSFGLNPVAVQADGAWANDTVYDPSWDGVWEGAAAITDTAWTAEFRIPFSQVAYSAKSGKTVWGINFYRNSPRYGESSVWAPRVPWLPGKVSRFNELHLEIPPTKHRLEIEPFILSGLQTRSADNSSIRAGADLKLGLGSAFQVSAAILPDFGQLEADPDQLNLTNFELFQTERRPFFIQGLDAFRFDSSLKFVTRDNSFQDETPFYSRRIGRAPRGALPPDATILAVPAATTILGAFKISGQTANGWNIGAFTATTQRESADVLDSHCREFQLKVEPMSQMEVLRIIKSVPRNLSSFGMFISNVRNLGLGEELSKTFIHRAWLAGIDGRYRFKSEKYEVAGWLLTSRLDGDAGSIVNVTRQAHHLFQRPDGFYLHDLGTNGSLSGISSQARFSRIGGNLHWDLFGEIISPGYDANEIGFQRNSDWILIGGAWQNEGFPSHGLIQHWVIGSDRLGVGWDWAGEIRARTVNGFIQIDASNYWKISASWVHDFTSLSTEWLRGGPALLLPARDSIHWTILSDQRLTTFAQLDSIFTVEPAMGSKTWRLTPQLYLWGDTHLRWSIGVNYQHDIVGWQYVARSDSATGPAYLVARDHQRTISPTLRADWAYSSHLILQLYFQPFVSEGRFDSYQELIDPRAPASGERFHFLDDSQIIQDPVTGISSVDLNSDGLNDFEFSTPDRLQRSSNANVILRWEYKPGSFITAAWNHRSDVTIPFRGVGLADSLRRLLSDRGSNVFLIKFSYHFSK